MDAGDDFPYFANRDATGDRLGRTKMGWTFHIIVTAAAHFRGELFVVRPPQAGDDR